MFVSNPNEYEKLYIEKYPQKPIDKISKNEFLDFVRTNKLLNKKDILKKVLSDILLNEGIEKKKLNTIVAKTLQNPDISKMVR